MCDFSVEDSQQDAGWGRGGGSVSKLKLEQKKNAISSVLKKGFILGWLKLSTKSAR